MKILLNMSETFFAYSELVKVTEKLKINEFLMSSDTLQEHIQVLKDIYLVELVKHKDLYNVLRDEVDLAITCTDGEDTSSTYLIKYCIKHRIPILLLTNITEHSSHLFVN